MKYRTHTRRIIWHHALADVANVSTIRSWHEAKGWEDVGYHFVVQPDGSWGAGRGIRYVGAHALGRNGDSIGVCLVGNFHSYEPSPEQLTGCCKLYHDLCRQYQENLRIEFHRFRWIGHHKYLPKWASACPGVLLDRQDFLEVVGRAAPY